LIIVGMVCNIWVKHYKGKVQKEDNFVKNDSSN